MLKPVLLLLLLAQPFLAQVVNSDRDIYGYLRIRKEFSLEGDITPSAVGANQNDYSPAGLADAYFVYASSSIASANITGLATGRDGRYIVFANDGATNDLVLKNADVLSAAANRFDCGADVTIGPKKSQLLAYKTADSRWKCIGSVSGTAGGAPTDAEYFVRTLNGTLTNERALSFGSTGMIYTDGGAGGTSTADVDSAKVALLSTSQSFAAGAKKTFVASATGAGFRMSPTAAPSTVNVEGDCYLDSTTHRWTCSDGTAFQRYMTDPFTTDGDIPYRSGGVPARLAATGTNTFLRWSGSVLSWATPLCDQVLGCSDNRVFNLTVNDVTAGVKGWFRVPYAGTITAVHVLANASGAATIDIWKDNWAAFLAGTIVDADSITAADPVTFTSARGVEKTSFTGWTLTFSAGDVFFINLDSSSGVANLQLQITTEIQ